jgi:3-isopropylmalate/(R)-2-methylmalate dehydratase large subunit
MPELSYPAYVKRLADVGVNRLARPERVVVAVDHETPVHSIAGAERIRLTRKHAREQGIGHLFDAEGITHPLVVERGLVHPGMFVAGADTHTPGLGGVGALAMPFGMEVAMAMATGRIWLKVPKTLRVRVDGRLAPGVGARDIVLQAMRLIGEDESSDCVVEYCGAAIGALSVPERMTICGLSVDMGADAGLIAADAISLAYLTQAGVHKPVALQGDANAEVQGEFVIDAATLAPQVSVPPSPCW